MHRPERSVPSERALTDRGYRVGQRHRDESRTVEGVVANVGQAIQVGAEIHLGERLIVAEGTICERLRAAQVDSLQLGHVPKGRVVHGLEAIGQGQGGNLRAHERTPVHVAQARRQSQGGDLRGGESALVDGRGPLGNRVVPAGVLRLRVGRQVGQTLRVQNPFDALVVLVGRVNLDALQERSTRECSEKTVGLDVRADVDGAQFPHVAESLEARHLERTRQRDVFERGVCEDAFSKRLQLRGMRIVILEGDLGQRLAREGVVIDRPHARGDPQTRQLRVSEGIRADLGHALGDANIRLSARVRHEHTVGVDGEPIGIGLQRGGCVHRTDGTRVSRERDWHADHGQGQGAGERERQHH